MPASNSVHSHNRSTVQYEELRKAHQHEASIQVEELKAAISAALTEFSEGELSPLALIEQMAGLGVEVRCSSKQLSALPEHMANAGPSR